MKPLSHVVASLSLFGLCLLSSASSWGADSQESSALLEVTEPTPIPPAKSIQSGLLLEPPLDLAWLTQEMFVKEISTVGANKLQKKWTSPVVQLPIHRQTNAKGLTEAEVKDYMRKAKQLFDQGKAIPVSDVGLISTQEDVVRQPMLNHVCAFENSSVRVFLLVQRIFDSAAWSYFSIVQDLTVDLPLDYYGSFSGTGKKIKFKGTSCYKCHSSGPLAIHSVREDLVLDAKLAAALNEYIADQPESRFYFPKHSPRPTLGKPLKLDACTSCHEEGGSRGPLYQVHSHPIRVMVDFGYMPPGEPLLPAEVEELQAWLDDKKDDQK